MATSSHNDAGRAPVAIGGVGGSGTRLVAQILIDGGVFLGDVLNESNDNLLFSLLLVHPVRIANVDPEGIGRRLRIFEKCMRGQVLTPPELGALVRSWRAYFAGPMPVSMPTTLGAYVRRLMGKTHSRWGWKEPNSHIFLGSLAAHFRPLKYVHVIRNAVDMAFNGNTQQLRRWGALFDIEVPRDEAGIPSAQLEYWIRANRRAIRLGRELLGEHFHVVSFDRLCRRPETEIRALLEFAELECPGELLRRLSRLPIPRAVGRRARAADLAVLGKRRGYDLRA